MTIPKIIHYCWFGEEKKSDEIKAYLKTWEILYDYKIIEWNEKNFDVNSCKFISKAYKMKKWAFVSDYVRVKVLYDYGGIYLDTDIEVLKSFNSLLYNKFFIGFIFDCSIGTAVIGSIKGHKVLHEIIELYEGADLIEENNRLILDFKLETNIKIYNNNDLFTTYLINKYKEFKLNNNLQEIDGITIYPKEYFERKTFNKHINYTIHHCSGSWWKSKELELNNHKKIFKRIKLLIKSSIIYDKYVCNNKMKKLPYYKKYLQDKKRMR